MLIDETELRTFRQVSVRQRPGQPNILGQFANVALGIHN